MPPFPGDPLGSMANSSSPNVPTQAALAIQQSLQHHYTHFEGSNDRPFHQDHRRASPPHVLEVSLSPGAHAGIIIASVLGVLASIAIMIWCTRLSFRVRPVQTFTRKPSKRNSPFSARPSDRPHNQSALSYAANDPYGLHRPSTPLKSAPAITCTAPTPPEYATEEDEVGKQTVASGKSTSKNAEKEFLAVPDLVHATRRAPEELERKRLLRTTMPARKETWPWSAPLGKYGALPRGWFVHDTKAEKGKAIMLDDGEDGRGYEAAMVPMSEIEVGESSGGWRERHTSGVVGLEPAMRDSGVQLAEADRKKLRTSDTFDTAEESS